MLRTSNLLIQSSSLLIICISLLLFNCSNSAGQEVSANARTIEVVGFGKASAKPDILIIEGYVTSKGKSVKKIIPKFLQIKKSLDEMINPMDFPDVEIELKDPVFNSGFNDDAMMMMEEGDMEDAGFFLSQPISIRIGIGKDESEKSTLGMLSKLVDTAETAGVTFSEVSDPMMHVVMQSGTTSLARGDLSDRKPLEKESTQVAFADAKSKAEELAKLAGGRLGKVISIEESGVTSNDTPTDEYMNMLMGKTVVDADSMLVIEVSQSLQVKFELID